MMRKKNKTIYGLALAAMIAVTASVTACVGQGGEEGTVSVQTEPHDDTKLSEMFETGANTVENVEQPIGMPNPFTDHDTLEEAEKEAGFPIQVPDEIGGVSASAFRNLGQELLEVIYYQGDQEVARVRKGTGVEDVSGDYREYSEVKTEALEGREVTFKGDDGKVVLAIWNDGTYAYSMSVEETEISQEEMATLVKGIQ